MTAPENPYVVGVISDTHGLLRPEAQQALRGSRLILHAGDVGDPRVLEALRELAPVVAVRGNIDRGAWAEALPQRQELRIEGFRVCLLHNRREWEGESGWDAVISGHSHRPGMEWQEKVLHFNPGSAGPRRFRLPVAIGRLFVMGDELKGEIVELQMASR